MVVVHVHEPEAKIEILVDWLNVVSIIHGAAGSKFVKQLRGAHCHTEPIFRAIVVLYGQLTQSGQVDNIESDLQAEGDLFVDVDRKLMGLVQKFPPELQEIVHELRDAYYELDESVTTVASIRIHTLRTQSEVMEILDTLESGIAADSLLQNEASRTLMYASLILAGIFFVLIALLLTHGMVSPLVRFVELLQNRCNTKRNRVPCCFVPPHCYEL